MVERYHAPVRRAYSIIREELPSLSKRASLKMAFKAINDTAGPKGLVPTLLVFGAYSKISNTEAPAVSVEQRAVAYRRAMEEVRKLRANRQIKDALRMRNGPITSPIRDLALQSKVLVWREGNNVQVQDNNDKPTAFRITSVKPYMEETQSESNISFDTNNKINANIEINANTEIEQIISQNNQGKTAGSPPLRKQPKRSAGRPNRYAIYFKTNRQIECQGIVNRKVTSYVTRDQIPIGSHIYKAKFIDDIKNKESEEWFEKSRLRIAAWGDKDKWTVLTQSPTIQRASQRAILAIAPLMLAKG
ncbi:hypothetical protein K3495_g15981, partial [Podosphaera aphanis]